MRRQKSMPCLLHLVGLVCMCDMECAGSRPSRANHSRSRLFLLTTDAKAGSTRPSQPRSSLLLLSSAEHGGLASTLRRRSSDNPNQTLSQLRLFLFLSSPCSRRFSGISALRYRPLLLVVHNGESHTEKRADRKRCIRLRARDSVA